MASTCGIPRAGPFVYLRFGKWYWAACIIFRSWVNFGVKIVIVVSDSQSKWNPKRALGATLSGKGDTAIFDTALAQKHGFEICEGSIVQTLKNDHTHRQACEKGWWTRIKLGVHALNDYMKLRSLCAGVGRCCRGHWEAMDVQRAIGQLSHSPPTFAEYGDFIHAYTQQNKSRIHQLTNSMGPVRLQLVRNWGADWSIGPPTD